MNGTLVNGFRVGKDNYYSLQHEDVMGFFTTESSVFQYLDEHKISSMFPSAMCEKYLIGKIVGEGAFSVVREGFERSTCRKVVMRFIKKAPIMSGSPPFIFRSRDELEQKILSASFDPMIGEAWMKVC